MWELGDEVEAWYLENAIPSPAPMACGPGFRGPEREEDPFEESHTEVRDHVESCSFG